MYGEPKDVEGKCNARLYLGDTYGDRHTTMVCQLDEGHEGLHQEFYRSPTAGCVTITWEAAEPDDSCISTDFPDDYRDEGGKNFSRLLTKHPQLVGNHDFRAFVQALNHAELDLDRVEEIAYVELERLYVDYVEVYDSYWGIPEEE